MQKYVNFEAIFMTQFDQNIHQNTANCTIYIFKILAGQHMPPYSLAYACNYNIIISILLTWFDSANSSLRQAITL